MNVRYNIVAEETDMFFGRVDKATPLHRVKVHLVKQLRTSKVFPWLQSWQIPYLQIQRKTVVVLADLVTQSQTSVHIQAMKKVNIFPNFITFSSKPTWWENLLWNHNARTENDGSNGNLQEWHHPARFERSRPRSLSWNPLLTDFRAKTHPTYTMEDITSTV
jgi:hypothetical protein